MPLNPNEIDPHDALAKCKHSLEYHCRFFHPDRFNRPFSENHKAFFELMDSDVQKVQIIAHRGFGKTSLCNLGIPSQKIMFSDADKFDYIVPVSASANSSVLQSENLKREMKTNTLCMDTIGDVKGDSDAKEIWTTSNQVMVMPRGANQQIRGILYGNDRPNLIIVDDLEKSDEVMSPDQRDKLKDWFMSDLLNSIDRSRDDWRIILIGTILHESSLMEDFRHDSGWTTVEFPLCDPEYKSYWPQFMSDKAIVDLKQDYSNQGKLEVFFREYMNDSTPKENAVFQSKFFKFYEEGDIDFDNPEIDTFILLDPAKSEAVHNDFTAIVGVSIDTSNNRIYVRDIINKHLRPEQIYAYTFDMADHLKTGVIGYEVTGLNEFIIQPMRDVMMTRGQHYELIELKARSAGGGNYKASGYSKGKLARIASLATYYRMGFVYHNKNCCGVLEEQLVSFPRAKHDDVSDAFAYFIEMMDRGDRTLSEEVDEEIEKQEMLTEEQEYRQLLREDEEPLDMRFMVG
jgi:hypothetical protein